MHLPQGVPGWTLFAFGLMVVAYRVHGIDAPRTWVEFVERQFTYAMRVRFVGGLLFVAAVVLYRANNHVGLLGSLSTAALLFLGLLGFGLLATQNHVRHLLVASAEASDKTLRLVSIVVVLLGLGLALLPFYL